MNSIPPEICNKILSYLSLRDLRSCSRVNKKLSSEAIRIIDKQSKVYLDSKQLCIVYSLYLHFGGRLHKQIRLNMKTSELAGSEGHYSRFMGKIQPSVEYCGLITFKPEANGILTPDDPSIRISDNLLHQILNLCPNFQLILQANDCPEYILQYFTNTDLNCLNSIQISESRSGFNQTKHDMIENILTSAVNLHELILSPPPFPPPPQIGWPLTLFSDEKLSKIDSICLLIEGPTIPEIYEDRRLVLKQIWIISYTPNIFNGPVERFIARHAASVENIFIVYPDVPSAGGIANFQLPEMPKLRSLILTTNRKDTLEYLPYFPTLPSKFPPSLTRIRIIMRFHGQNLLETQLKSVFRHQWDKPMAKFPVVNTIEMCECYSVNPKCKARVGDRIIRKLNKMFPNAEIQIGDEKLKKKLVISRFGKREKLYDKRR